MVGKRSDLPETGALNPYALVSSRKGIRIDWKNLSFNKRKEMIEQELKLPFHKLFDPKYNSPLFVRVGNSANPDPASTRTGDLVPRCAAAVASWQPKVDGAFTCPLPAGKPAPDINDANQGCSLNCWFIAALASVSWAWPDFIHKYAVAENPCRLRLYKPLPSSATPPYFPAAGTDYTADKPVLYSPSNKLPWGAKGPATPPDWVFTRPASAHPTVLWSALMEKCYANFWALDGSANDQPNIAKFGTGCPLHSLFHLTGKRFYTLLDITNYPKYLQQTAFFMAAFPTADDVFSKIYSSCYKIITRNSGPVVPAMTLYPTVAWTYPSEAAANKANKIDPVAHPENSVKYLSDSIVANHSYSILGVHYADGKKYIVLRNPWGMAIPGAYGGDPKFIDPNIDPSDDIYYQEMTAAIKTGVWTVTPKAGLYNTILGAAPKAVSIDLGRDDGIFALAVDKFRLHFQGFGWVTP